MVYRNVSDTKKSDTKAVAVVVHEISKLEKQIDPSFKKQRIASDFNFDLENASETLTAKTIELRKLQQEDGVLVGNPTNLSACSESIFLKNSEKASQRAVCLWAYVYVNTFLTSAAFPFQAPSFTERKSRLCSVCNRKVEGRTEVIAKQNEDHY